VRAHCETGSEDLRIPRSHSFTNTARLTALAEHMAHRQTGLAAADDQCSYALNWHSAASDTESVMKALMTGFTKYECVRGAM
jgi:hypothetical protein